MAANEDVGCQEKQEETNKSPIELLIQAMHEENTSKVQILHKPTVLSSDSAVWRIVWGEPESVGELAFSVGLDFIVIGDIRDVVKEGWLFVASDPEFNPAVLGLAAIGILSTGSPTDPLFSAGKNFYKIVGGIAIKSKPVAELLLKHGRAAITTGDKTKLDQLIKLATHLKQRADLSSYQKLLNVPGNTQRLARYVDEGGDGALHFVERQVTRYEATTFWVTGKQITDKLTVTPDYRNRLKELKARYGLPETASGTDLAKKLNQALQNPKTKKVIHKHPTSGDSFGFYTPEGVFLPFKSSGDFITVFPASWDDYVMKQKWILEIK